MVALKNTYKYSAPIIIIPLWNKFIFFLLMTKLHLLILLNINIYLTYLYIKTVRSRFYPQAHFHFNLQQEETIIASNYPFNIFDYFLFVNLCQVPPTSPVVNLLWTTLSLLNQLSWNYMDITNILHYTYD